jgi:tRNA A37 threonylcarbamoyladenosine modification protein TsaB
VHGVCSLDAIGIVATRSPLEEVLVVTDARRREVYWARYRDGARIDGPAVNAAADVPLGSARAVAGSPEHAGLFNLPCIGPACPSPVGLVRAVADWAKGPAGDVVGTTPTPLYLRRPDARSLAERQAGGQ